MYAIQVSLNPLNQVLVSYASSYAAIESYYKDCLNPLNQVLVSYKNEEEYKSFLESGLNPLNQVLVSY